MRPVIGYWHRRAIERVAPPSILVDEAHRVIHLSENAGRYITPDLAERTAGIGGYCCALTGMESAPRAETAHTGTSALMYSGTDLSATASYSYNRIFDVDLEAGRITAHLPGGEVTESFTVPEGARRMLLEGLDEIGLTLQHGAEIAAYEQAHPELTPARA